MKLHVVEHRDLEQCADRTLVQRFVRGCDTLVRLGGCRDESFAMGVVMVDTLLHGVRP